MTRHDEIRTHLNYLEQRGMVHSWYAYAPGDSRGKRWVVETAMGTQVFSTHEVESYIRVAAQQADTIEFDPPWEGQLPDRETDKLVEWAENMADNPDLFRD